MLNDCKSDYQVALDRCKRNKLRNAINIVISGAVLVAVIFIAVTWVQTKANKAVFDENLALVESYIQQTEFEKADSLLTLSLDNFRPPYMKPFVISGTVKATRKELNDEIDKFVTATIGNVTKMRKANRGRIDKYSWELVKRALDLARRMTHFRALGISILNNSLEKIMKKTFAFSFY